MRRRAGPRTKKYLQSPELYPLSNAWQCQFRVTHSRITFDCPRVCCGFRKPPSAPSCAGPKATGRTSHHYSANLRIARRHCFTLLNFSFAMRVSDPVTPIFVSPVETPAPCHVRLGGATLKLGESFPVCRTRLSLPYVLRSTSVLVTAGRARRIPRVRTERGAWMCRRHSHQEMSPSIFEERHCIVSVTLVRWISEIGGIKKWAYDTVAARSGVVRF
jgi:hypothetical protein